MTDVREPFPDCPEAASVELASVPRPRLDLQLAASTKEVEASAGSSTEIDAAMSQQRLTALTRAQNCISRRRVSHSAATGAGQVRTSRTLKDFCHQKLLGRSHAGCLSPE